MYGDKIKKKGCGKSSGGGSVAWASSGPSAIPPRFTAQYLFGYPFCGKQLAKQSICAF